MSTPLIRNGALVSTPLAGMAYDVKQLNAKQLDELRALIAKAEGQDMLTQSDLSNLAAIRSSAKKSTAMDDASGKLSALLEQLK